MKDLKVYEDENYNIKYSSSLEGFIQDELALANRQRQKMVELFGQDILSTPSAVFDEKQKKLVQNPTKEKLQIKGALFDSRQDFFDYVAKISKGSTKPSDIATGIFCQGQIIGWIDKDEMGNLMHGVLAHETVHVFFFHLVTYKPVAPIALYTATQTRPSGTKTNSNFLRWFEECYAYYFDDAWSGFSREKKKSCLEKAKTFLGADLNNFNDEVGKSNFGSAMRVIGQYIFETGQAKNLLKTFKTDDSKIRELGKTILKDAIDYFEEQLKEKT